MSVPVESFSQANEAQFYVSMSRARSDASFHGFKGCAAGGGDAQKRQALANGIDCGRQRRSHAKKLITKLLGVNTGQKKVNGQTIGARQKEELTQQSTSGGLAYWVFQP